MMKLHWILTVLLKFVLNDRVESYNENNVADNELACPYDRVCVPIDYCPGVESLMVQKAIPAQRFRLAICGYESTRPKVCCSPAEDPNSPDRRLRLVYEHSEQRSDCGRSFVPTNVGGTSALGSFPFLAKIGFINLITGEMKYPCVGTLINARTVLTTGTCALAKSDKYKLQSVLVGEFDSFKNPDCNDLFCGHEPASHKISYVVKHPGFNSETFESNIALVRLQEPINFTVTAQPACVFTGREFNLLEMDQVRLFGWGKLSTEINPSQKIRSMYMRLLSRQDCSDFANQGLCVELCAIGEHEPCAGFSGSPIIRLNGNKYTVVGILSYGSHCNENSNSPVSFVDIQRYAEWILKN
ncbi:phenoloxidase-activating enzyme 1-like isoform X2 [Venturia canescens]|nr:phenoloxidase-activating enzyme 1-like isoform X2 [Venturia canescens]